MTKQEQGIQKIWELLLEDLSYYEASEEAVKLQIVLPLLNALGWNTLNPKEVKHNYITDEGIPLTALCINGDPILILEIKKLGSDISQPENIKQIARYCFSEGIKYGLLTNGRFWLLFKAFEEGKRIGDRIIWAADLQNSSTFKAFNAIKRASIENFDSLFSEIKHPDDEFKEVIASMQKAPERVENLTSAPLTEIDSALPIDDFTKFYVLLLLYEGPSHGYGIMAKYHKRTGRSLSAGTLYPFLQYLESKGLLYSQDKSTGRRPRKEYSLTVVGRKESQRLFDRFTAITAAAFQSNIQVCASCGCKVYEGAHFEVINGAKRAFCCSHCANAYQRQLDGDTGE